MPKANTAPSMRTALLLWLLIPLIGLVVLSTVVASHFAESFANKFFDSFLLNSADSIGARVHKDHDRVAISDLTSASKELFGHDGKDQFFYRVVGRNGQTLAGDARIPWQQALDFRPSAFSNTHIDGSPVRLCTVHVEVGGDTLWVQVGETLNSRQILLNEVFLSILMPQIVLVALAGSVVWVGIGRGLRPLHRLGTDLRARTKPDLSPIDVVDTPAELLPVTTAINQLFVIVDGHYRSQREFVADAAHQLRTPVTALKTYMDHLVTVDCFDRSVIGQLSKTSNRLAEMVNRLLILARAEAKRANEAPISDLSMAVADAANVAVQQALKSNIELHFDIPTYPVYVRIEKADLIEIVVNLLDNAIKYIPENSSVWLIVKTCQDNVSLTVEDNGPGIPDEQKEKVFKRFFRLNDTEVSGCGLGLSIVQEICLATNAKVALSERAGGGASFRITFPSCSDSEH